MAQQGTSDPHGDPNYRETVEPQNPPNAVLNSKVGMATWALFMGSAVAVFAIFAWVYLALGGPQTETGAGERDAVGTVGERSPGTEQQPGGGSADPRFDGPRDEIKYRGGDLARRIELKDVNVESVANGTFQVRDGRTRTVVVAPSGSAMPRPGQRVDIVGTIEGSGEGARIRTERIDVRP
jgi:hypothetical protein